VAALSNKQYTTPPCPHIADTPFDFGISTPKKQKDPKAKKRRKKKKRRKSFFVGQPL
jgi:hypothetical protein